MERICHENADRAARDLPFLEDKVLSAHDAISRWTEPMGKIEQEKRQRELLGLKDKITASHSDKRHWKLQAQAWRDFLNIHRELGDAQVGVKCSHGYIAPVCVIEHAELKRTNERQREPGDDDGDEDAYAFPGVT